MADSETNPRLHFLVLPRSVERFHTSKGPLAGNVDRKLQMHDVAEGVGVVVVVGVGVGVQLMSARAVSAVVSS